MNPQRVALFALLCGGGIRLGAQELPAKDADFRVLVAREIPIGSPFDTGIKRAQALGLNCKWAKGAWSASVPQAEFYFCDRRTQGLVQTRWQIALLPKGDSVAEVVASVGLIGP